jgi:integrase
LGRTKIISPATVVNLLRRRCEELAERRPGFRTACFTPHDFRRLFATELVNNGLPIHIGAADDEYRNVTEQEWREFEEHFDRRKG